MRCSMPCQWLDYLPDVLLFGINSVRVNCERMKRLRHTGYRSKRQNTVIFIVAADFYCCPDIWSGKGKKIINIGVLAVRGAEQCLKSWSPTADYLTSHIPGYIFVILPLTHERITRKRSKCRGRFHPDQSIILCRAGTRIWCQQDRDHERAAAGPDLFPIWQCYLQSCGSD